MTRALATVFFVDVGRGSSQLVLFPNHDAVLIDAGKNSEPVERLIETLRINRFTNVVISHWHADHCEGIPRLLRKYRDRIDVVRVPGAPQRNDGQLMHKKVLPQIKSLRWTGTKAHYGLTTLEYDCSFNGLISPVPIASPDANLRIVYPDREDRDIAEQGTDTNQASGIFVLECGSTRVLFPGDAGQVAFERLSMRLGADFPIPCDVIAAPHHAGRLGQKEGPVGNHANAYRWLYSEILRPAYVVIGSGTEKNAKHPRDTHVEAIATSCASIHCTQLTDQCHIAPETFANGVFASGCYPGKHQYSGTACMGTIMVEIFRDRVQMMFRDEHQMSIDKHLDLNKALCRRFTVTPSSAVIA